MICAYSKCGKGFEPSRANQVYHSRQCRELAKREKHPVIHVRENEVRSVKSFLTRKRSGVHRMPCVPGSELWFLRRAALWLGGRA